MTLEIAYNKVKIHALHKKLKLILFNKTINIYKINKIWWLRNKIYKFKEDKKNLKCY